MADLGVKGAVMKDLATKDKGAPDFDYWSYDELVRSFEVETLPLEVVDNDYQGDSRLLLRDGDRYGLLIFGWGSCSGCDALQACSTHADVTALRDQMWNSVHWEPTKADLLRYVEQKDWELDYYGHQQETREFVAKAKEVLAA